MRLLITGIHGFVGTNLVAALKDKAEIYGLDIVAPLREGVIRTFCWDDLEAGRLPRVDAIVHLAAIVHDVEGKVSLDEMIEVNAGLTGRIFDYFTTHGEIGKFVHFSSVAAVADKVAPGTALTEEAECRPIEAYGESKKRAEEHIMGKLASRPEAYAGRSIVVLRPGMIHGPGNKGNLNLLYRVVAPGFPWPLGAFDNRRSFTSVGNLTYVVERLLAEDIPSGIYNMADDDPVSTNRLVEIICETVGRRPRIWRIPRRAARLGAKLGDWLRLPLNSRRLSKLTDDFVVSNAKIKWALSIDRMPVGAEEGLRRTVRRL